MALGVGILGASGYGGGGLIRRLLRHPEVHLSGIASRRYVGKPIQACWPQYAGLLDLSFEEPEAVIESSEVVFCATPHRATAPLVDRALGAGKRVVDLSADFRLDPETYRHWYGVDHPHPERFAQARYGLVELHREDLAGADLVASPGCNATCASLALAPLAAAGLLGETAIADILTGVSGAGRSEDLPYIFSELQENAWAYKVAGSHRHIAEIERTLARARTMGKRLRTHEAVEAGPKVAFTPHLTPMTRGILATCYVRPSGTDLGSEELLDLYRDYYQGDPLIHVQNELPQTKAVWGSDRAVLAVRRDPRSGWVIAFAAIDNLGKGAAGQAVQGFNVAHGFAETAGLILEGEWP